MPKGGVLLVAAAFVAVLAGLSSSQGCHDTWRAWTHLAYYDVRDMRHSVALLPQRGFYRSPDSASVPITGIERPLAGHDMMVEERTAFAAQQHDPVPPADVAASAERGRIKFQKTCVPCHGTSLAGDGPVAPFFMPPPDLQGEHARGLSDGWIYSYIRHGGAIMPSYGAQVTPEEAWDLVHYLRHPQQVQPRQRAWLKVPFLYARTALSLGLLAWLVRRLVRTSLRRDAWLLKDHVSPELRPAYERLTDGWRGDAEEAVRERDRLAMLAP